MHQGSTHRGGASGDSSLGKCMGGDATRAPGQVVSGPSGERHQRGVQIGFATGETSLRSNPKNMRSANEQPQVYLREEVG